MAEISNKTLNDEVSHNFLIQSGFVNIRNSFPTPCYKDPRGQIIQLAPDTIIHGPKDLYDIYYKIGFVAGATHTKAKLSELLIQL